MIKNSILFYYDKDKSHGDYFLNCADYATCLLNLKKDIKQTHIKNNNCNCVYIDEVELPKHKEKSLFIIYSHGNTNSFFKSGEQTAFIHSTIDCDICLDGGLVYTNACSTGEKFGKSLPKKKASFFGYDKEIEVYFNYKKIFVECDNWGLYRILEGDTLEESRIEAKRKFNQEMLNIYKDNPLAAAALEVAKDSIVIYGNLSKQFV